MPSARATGSVASLALAAGSPVLGAGAASAPSERQSLRVRDTSRPAHQLVERTRELPAQVACDSRRHEREDREEHEPDHRERRPDPFGDEAEPASLQTRLAESPLVLGQRRFGLGRSGCSRASLMARSPLVATCSQAAAPLSWGSSTPATPLQATVSTMAGTNAKSARMSEQPGPEARVLHEESVARTGA